MRKQRLRPPSVKQQVLRLLLLRRQWAERSGRPALFTGAEVERVDPLHSMSGLRRLRELAKDGLVTYEVTDAGRSQYRVDTPSEELMRALVSLRR